MSFIFLLIFHQIPYPKLFNEYFESVYSKLHSQVPVPENDVPPVISIIHITEEEVFTALSLLNPQKASGIDGIGPKLLKSCALALHMTIHHLFTVSLESQCLPYEWKIHRIIPIFKSGDRNSASNYRPISLLCSISKVLESLVYNKVTATISNLITPHQFGFLQNHSCLQQILSFLSDVIEAFESRQSVDTVYLDFKKAFDSVHHNLLLHKLKTMGISGSLWNWFKCYLTNRMQLVSVNNQHSQLLPVSSGVPQGSILGPLLFLIYINDMPLCVKCGIFLFADDTKCCHRIQSLSDVRSLQSDLDSLSEWSEKWMLPFNVSKCIVLHLRRSTSQPSVNTYSLNKVHIPDKPHHRDLGLMIHQNLNWSTHYNTILAKAYKILYMLKRTFSSANSIVTKKALYIALVRSQVTYCSPVWRPSLIKDILLLERLQRRSTKFILGSMAIGMNYKERLKSLDLFPLMYWLEIADIMFFINSFKQQSARFNIMTYVTLSSLPTRSSNKITLSHSRSSSNLTRHFYFNRTSSN